jgi:hypothetical protein
MGMGTKPRRTLSLVGKNKNSTSWRNQNKKHSPSHCASIRVEYKKLSNLGLERQGHIQPNFKHRCLLQVETNTNRPKLSALMFSHKAAQQNTGATPSKHQGRHQQSNKGNINIPTREAPTYQQGRHQHTSRGTPTYIKGGTQQTNKGNTNIPIRATPTYIKGDTNKHQR